MELEDIKREVLEAWFEETVGNSDRDDYVYRSSRDVMVETHDTILLEAQDVYEFMRGKQCSLVDRDGTMKWRIPTV